MFKIRNKDGEFSGGGVWPEWTKVGKTWMERGHLSGHLTQTDYESFYSEDDEVVEFVLVEVGSEPLTEYNADRLERRKDRAERKEQEALTHQKDFLQGELGRIQAKIDNLP